MNSSSRDHAPATCAATPKSAPAFDARDRRDARLAPKGFTGAKWEYHQPWLHHRLRHVGHGGGYVMVRKARAFPFVITEKEWLAFPLWADRVSGSGEAVAAQVDRESSRDEPSPPEAREDGE